MKTKEELDALVENLRKDFPNLDLNACMMYAQGFTRCANLLSESKEAAEAFIEREMERSRAGDNAFFAGLSFLGLTLSLRDLEKKGSEPPSQVIQFDQHRRKP